MLCAADTTLYNSIRRSPINDPGEYLSVGAPESDAYRLPGLGRGLNQAGCMEGRNFVIEYRWAGAFLPR